MALGFILLHGCAGSAATTGNTTADKVQPDETISTAPPADNPEHDQWRMEAEELWKRRSDPSALEQAITRWERLARESAMVVESHIWLARAYLLRGQGLTSDAALEAFERGAAAAQAAVSHASQQDSQRAEARYWLLANRAARAFRGPYIERVDSHQELLHSARELVDEGIHVDDDGARRILAALLASPPLFELRDLEAAKGHYEKLIAAHPGHLASQLAYAEHYGVATQDLSLFKAQLKSVLEAQPGSADDELAQRDAVQLLEKAPYLFE